MNIATQAGSSTSSSSGRTRRTSGSAGTGDGVLVAMSGWCGRTSRAGPQEGSSSSHNGATDSRGPTIVAHRRPWRRARSAKIRAASRSGLDGHEVGAGVAGRPQPTVDDVAPHLAGEPHRVDADGPHPRLDEHMGHRVAGQEVEHFRQIGLAKDTQGGHPQHGALLLPAHSRTGPISR